MTKFFAIVAFAVALPMSNSAHANIKCDKIEKAGKKAKCEKKMGKKLEKLRANTTPIKPSDVGSEFSYLDGKNPFNSDDFYLGYKESNFKEVTELSKKIASAKGLIKLTTYAGHLNKSDKAAAKKLGGKLLPRLQKLEEEMKGIEAASKKIDHN